MLQLRHRLHLPAKIVSTPLRRLMLLQQACFLGWMSAIPVIVREFDVLMEVTLMASTIAGIFWYVMGTSLTSEWPHLSRRVQRSLPQSTLGRAFFTWFNPGPGTGFVFSVANLTTIVALGLLLLSFNGTAMIASLTTVQAIYFLVFGWCYVVIFLGVGILLISVLRRFFYVSMTAGCLIQFILLMLASGIPQAVSLLTSLPGGSNTYSLMHITNPMWTLFTLLESGPLTVEALDAHPYSASLRGRGSAAEPARCRGGITIRAT